MDFDLLYFDDDDLYKASRLLEEFNKSSYQMALNQQSAYTYYDLLKDAEKGEKPFTKQTNESKNGKTSDKMLFESWKRYLRQTVNAAMMPQGVDDYQDLIELAAKEKRVIINEKIKYDDFFKISGRSFTFPGL